jgi:hypothetical protein
MQSPIPLDLAILLGDKIGLDRSPYFYLGRDSETDRPCGCGLGRASLVARSIDAATLIWTYPEVSSHNTEAYTSLKELWPSLSETNINEIGDKFHFVAINYMTIEDFAQWVRENYPEACKVPEESFDEVEVLEEVCATAI